MFGSIRAVSSIHTRFSIRYFTLDMLMCLLLGKAIAWKNKKWPVHHETFLIQLYLFTQPSWDIRCYINSASLFGNPSPRSSYSISSSAAQYLTLSRKSVSAPGILPQFLLRPRYTGSSAAPAPSICYVGFPPIFPPFHSTSTVVEHYARYAATRWKPTSLFSPPPLRVMSALSIFWRH